ERQRTIAAGSGQATSSIHFGQFPTKWKQTASRPLERQGGTMRIARSLLLLGFVLAATLFANVALAQAYPSKPVKLIVTYPPAGSSDLMARILAEKLSELWGQPVIVENKPSAAGSIGMEYASHQAPDGASFVIANLGPAVINPILSKVPYD